MGMNLQTHRRAEIRQAVKNIERDENQIADTANIDDHFAGLLLREFAADLRDHVKPTGRVNELSIGRSTNATTPRPQGRRHFRHHLGNPAGERLPVEMADRGGKSVRGIRRHRSRYFQYGSDHHLHLLLGGVAIAHHRRFYLHRAILVNLDILLSRRQQRDAARLAEFQGALDILRKENFFQADAVRVKLAHDICQFGVDPAQAARLGLGA